MSSDLEAYRKQRVGPIPSRSAVIRSSLAKCLYGIRFPAEEIRGAVARGWCHSKNSHKEMDGDLAIAISEEIEKYLREKEQA